MKTLLIIIGLLASQPAFSQSHPISGWSHDSDQNIVVEKLEGDSLTTSFLIQVKENVPRHYHDVHSEHVYVLSGAGSFVLNADTFAVKPGDYVFIPSKSHHEVWVSGDSTLQVLSIQAPEFLGKDRIPVNR